VQEENGRAVMMIASTIIVAVNITAVVDDLGMKQRTGARGCRMMIGRGHEACAATAESNSVKSA